MAGLTYHKALTGPTAYVAGEAGEALRAKFNSNEDTLLDAAQAVEDRAEDLVYELHGSGVLTGMVASAGTGLSVDVTQGSAIIGIIVDYAGGAISVLANQTNAPLYFGQDGNWYTAAPSEVSYFEFCTYTSNDSAVTAVGETAKVMLCSLQTVTDTFEDLAVDSSHEREYKVDHSASLEFLVPGFITVSVSPSDAFTVEHINAEDDTGTTFSVKITRNASYRDYADYYIDGEDHGDYAYCDLTFSRTGLANG